MSYLKYKSACFKCLTQSVISIPPCTTYIPVGWVVPPFWDG